MKFKYFLVLLIATISMSSFAANTGDEYSAEGKGICFANIGVCAQTGHAPVSEKLMTFEECKSYGTSAFGGLISWLNLHGKCIYLDPSGD